MTRETLQQFDLPDAPGVYLFTLKKEILYIGKATSLRDRVRSYFSADLPSTRGPKIERMIQVADGLSWQETDSVLEALLREAEFIRRYHPPANTDGKDDKTWNYVILTAEAFPVLRTIRGRELEQGKQQITDAFGPFPNGRELKEALNIIRRIFPYRDEKCPGPGHAPCFNAQIGRCPGVCTGAISRREYARTVAHLRLFFRGKKARLLQQLERAMRTAAAKKEFERAGEIRDQIFALRHIQDVALLGHSGPTGERRGVRIEAYDIAHLSGTHTVGVMTVVQNGEADRAAYRKFRIRGVGRDQAHDIESLEEVLRRRFAHPEWPLPALLVIDGGRAQLAAAERVLAAFGFALPVVAVVKNERHQPREILGRGPWKHEYERDIVLAVSEAHRFGVAYHRKLRQKPI